MLGLLFAYGWLFGVLTDNSVKTNIVIHEAPDGLESSYDLDGLATDGTITTAAKYPNQVDTRHLRL